MQTQDAPAEFLFKLWPWLEANRNRLIGGLVAIAVIAGVLFFISAQREQREIAAGQAVTAVVDSSAAEENQSQMASSLEQLAATYAGTAAGQRAQVEAAGALFEAGNYADAQTQFQKYIEANPSGQFAATAELGVAACLEALGKPDLAAAAYQRVLSVYPGSPFVVQAEFGLGRIDEQQNKMSEAVSYYDKVVAAAMGGTLAQEAAMRSSQLKIKMAAAAPQAVALPQPGAAPKVISAPPPAAKP